MSKQKKGDEVTLVGIWNDGSHGRSYGPSAGTIYLRRCVVQSWGKVQGTLTDALTGEYIKVRISSDQNTVAGTDAERAAIVATLSGQIASYRLKRIALDERWLEDYPDSPARPGCLRRLEVEKALVGSEPRVVDRRQLMKAKLIGIQN